jgi:hypothetical protein
VDANAELDDSPARVQDPLRRPTTRVNRLHINSDALLPDTGAVLGAARHFERRTDARAGHADRRQNPGEVDTGRLAPTTMRTRTSHPGSWMWH